jgi:hypothetical protein
MSSEASRSGKWLATLAVSCGPLMASSQATE